MQATTGFISRVFQFWTSVFRPLAARIALVVIASLLLIGSVFAYFAHKTGTGLLEQQAYAKTHAVAAVSKVILEHLMLDGRRDRLERALGSALESEQASEVFVLDKEGRVAYRSQGLSSLAPAHSLDIARVVGSNTERYSMHRINGLYSGTVVMALENKKECAGCHRDGGPLLGYLYVTVSLNDLSNTALHHRNTNILSTALAFLSLGVIIFVSLFLMVVRPLTRVQKQIGDIEYRVGSIGDGEQIVFSPLEADNASGEIADVVSAFNSMVRKLNELHQHLHVSHLRELEQADRIAAVGEMAASIAHEIRNPLAGLHGALRVLQYDFDADHPHRRIVHEMMEQLARMNQTISDLLMYAKPSPPFYEPTELGEVLTRSVTLLKAQFGEIRIAIQCALPPDPVPIEADAKQLQQVFWNLVQNAGQAVGSNGSVTVRLDVGPDFATVRITDTGSGIPEELRERIFKPFVTTKSKGTGLGLAISRSIMEQHNGTLELESSGSHGTTFRAVLPLRRTHTQEEQ
jgi:signal transduction histidine kinase